MVIHTIGRINAQPWPEPPAPPPAQAPPLRQGCFYLLVLVPIACALLQLFTWSQFTLHGRRLHMVKAASPLGRPGGAAL